MNPSDVVQERILEEVAQLRDLFQRRLVTDKAKERLIDELSGQVAFAQRGIEHSMLSPLYRELLLVVDRIQAVAGQDDEALSSVSDELLEILERRDVRRIPDSVMFDAVYHEVSSTIEASADAGPGVIVSVVRDGYLLGESVLRPARVVVTRATSSSDAACVEGQADSGAADGGSS